MLEAVLEQILQPLLLDDTMNMFHQSSLVMEETDDIINGYIASHPNEYLDFLRLSPSQIQANIQDHELILARINQQQDDFA